MKSLKDKFVDVDESVTKAADERAALLETEFKANQQRIKDDAEIESACLQVLHNFADDAEVVMNNAAAIGRDPEVIQLHLLSMLFTHSGFDASKVILPPAEKAGVKVKARTRPSRAKKPADLAAKVASLRETHDQSDISNVRGDELGVGPSVPVPAPAPAPIPSRPVPPVKR